MFTDSSREPKTHGFTLVELLVVIAIIGMLVAILLPAVNAARDAGRRTQSINNLKNIGLATLQYNESQSSLPPLRFIGDKQTQKAGKKYPASRNSVSWAFELLPFLEQNNIYERFDKTQPVHHPSNSLAMRTPLEMYANPLLREASANCIFPGYSADDASAPRGTCIDYAANRGFYDTKNSNTDMFTMNFDPRNVGPYVHNSLVTMAHVKDGTSKTISIGDRYVRPGFNGLPDQCGLAGASSSTIMRGVNGTVSNNGYDVENPFPIGSKNANGDYDGSEAYKFGGAGSIAAAFVFLDGHTKIVEYVGTDPIVIRALCTIDGGEVVTDDY